MTDTCTGHCAETIERLKSEISRHKQNEAVLKDQLAKAIQPLSNLYFADPYEDPEERLFDTLLEIGISRETAWKIAEVCVPATIKEEETE